MLTGRLRVSLEHGKFKGTKTNGLRQIHAKWGITSTEFEMATGPQEYRVEYEGKEDGVCDPRTELSIAEVSAREVFAEGLPTPCKTFRDDSEQRLWKTSGGNGAEMFWMVQCLRP